MGVKEIKSKEKTNLTHPTTPLNPLLFLNSKVPAERVIWLLLHLVSCVSLRGFLEGTGCDDDFVAGAELVDVWGLCAHVSIL